MKRPVLFFTQIALLALYGAVLSGPAQGQAVSILHSFNDGSVTNDVSSPESMIQGADGNFYVVSSNGGSAGTGAVVRVTPQGLVTSLCSFTSAGGLTYPTCLVPGLDGNLYGATQDCHIFQLTLSGQLNVICALTGISNGAVTALVAGSDGNFYGTSAYDGTASRGAIFQTTPVGVTTILHSFGDGSVTNDGWQPNAVLLQGSDGNFYGTTSLGGSTLVAGSSNGYGIVFKINAQGALTILHNFGDGSVTNDGKAPSAGLIQGYDGNFYGVTVNGGTTGSGVIYKMTAQGQVTIFHSFNDSTSTSLFDGATPQTSLVLGYDDNLYGLTTDGGSAGYGALFEISPQGIVTTLHSVYDGTVPNEGYYPSGIPLVEGPGGIFYGVTNNGGSSGVGEFFSLNPKIPTLTSSLSVAGAVSLPFTYTPLTTNTPASYSATNLPDGLTISASTGIISGTPTTVETNPVILTLTSAAGANTIPLTITIGALPAPAITSMQSEYGVVGTAFSYQTTASNTATSFSATGLDSTGLSLNSTTGVISGTPTAAGTISVSLTATNASGAGTATTLIIQVFTTPATLAQEYSVVQRFQDGTPGNAISGKPVKLILGLDGNLYGLGGGAYNTSGDIFQVTPQGHTSIFFSFGSQGGEISLGDMVQGADGNFYVAANFNQAGQFYRVTPEGQATLLYSANNFSPGPLTQGYDGNFYGVTQEGGTASEGFAFKLSPQGKFTVLHNFGDGSVANDATDLGTTLAQGSDGNFYGTSSGGGSTATGGSYGLGFAFKMTPQGTVTILHSFGDGTVPNDAQSPNGLIEASDGNFYGTSFAGGSTASASSAGYGTVFKMTPAGQVTILYSFTASTDPQADGKYPDAALIQGLDGNFYGTTSQGGNYTEIDNTIDDGGIVFQITPQGTETILHEFSQNGTITEDGDLPSSPLVQDLNGNFFGVTGAGGINPQPASDYSGYGIVYSVQARQTATHVPIYTGAAYEEAPLSGQFFFTPRAAFGASGTGAETGNSVQATGGGALMDAVLSFLPSLVHKNFNNTNWTLTQGNTPSTMLPNDLSFDPTSGTISGTPVEARTFTFTMTPNNALGSGTAQTVTLYIDVPPAINSAATITCAVGTPFTYQISATPPADLYAATFLPAWLSADPVTGLITGTPPAAGSYVFDAVATNVSGPSVQTVALTVTGGSSSVPTITSGTAASGTVGRPFTYQILTTPAATTYSALALPAGLVFDVAEGLITGIPSQAGTFSIPLAATSANGSYSSVLTLAITAPMPPTIARALLATAAESALFSYQIPATGAVTTYGSSALPTGLTLDSTTGLITGHPTVPGSFPVTITVSNSNGSSTSMLTLDVAAATNYSAWATAYGVTGGLIGTPKGDQVPNLLKYLNNIDPAAPISTADRAALPLVGTATVGGMPYLTVTYRQYALESGLTVVVQTSSDLHTWTTVNPPDLSRQVGTDPVTGDPLLQLGVRATGSLQFARLEVVGQ